ncbi:MAG: hypothetical protein HYS83_01425 [Candidatus Blackburnbacteria bacterium]|nr:hypothetical protein [Candidatus Blackburnbacteria bacterium]
MSAVERRYCRQWLRPTEDKALARLGRANNKPMTRTCPDGADSQITSLLTDVREGKISTRVFWIRRSRILKGRRVAKIEPK